VTVAIRYNVKLSGKKRGRAIHISRTVVESDFAVYCGVIIPTNVKKAFNVA